jgi:2,3-bisphosphoglycerate-dependent phosphoglycerate mutase
MARLILLRHGESIWNRDNRFTGWRDVDLSEEGIAEAHRAATQMKQLGLWPDWCCTSYLKRAIRTLWIVLDDLDRMWLPTDKSWRLNERHYGALEGLKKAELAEQVGADQVRTWRRSYDIRPPALEKGDERFPGNDPRYSALSDDEVPRTESLKDTLARVVPYWNDVLSPQLKAGRCVLVSGHGNTFRALIKHLEHIPDEEISSLEIPLGIPLVYELDASLRPVERHFVGTS